MKSWADHCSSDEEDEDIPRVQVPPQVKESDSESDYSDNEEEEHNNNNRGNNSGSRNNNYNRDRNPRPPPVLPTSKPFTAFVGNLSYEIQDAKHLAYELERLCGEKLQKPVTAVDGRLMTDRESGMKKGYGYIEFDTVEDVSCSVPTCIFMFFSNLTIFVPHTPTTTRVSTPADMQYRSLLLF